MSDSLVHKMARFLLRLTLHISPAGMKDWGRAMLSELDYVENPRAAMRWAIGCSCALAWASIREAVMGRKPLVPAALSVGAVVLLLLVPGFRQGLNASITSWELAMFSSRGPQVKWPDSRLRALALEAEERKDGKALAFVAARLTDTKASVRIARQAVALDSSLTWVYYVLALRNPALSEMQFFATKLREWDPENAASYLVVAHSLDSGALFEQGPLGLMRKPPTGEWIAAMEAATKATRFDDYLRLQIDSDRDVVQRYGIWDPLLFIKGYKPGPRFTGDIQGDVRNYSRASGTLQPADRGLLRYLQEHGVPESWGRPTPSVSFVQIGSLLMAGSVLLLVIGTVWRRRVVALGLTGAVCLIVSATILYAAYLPYARSFYRLVTEGDLSEFESVRSFHTYGFLPGPGMRNPLLMESVRTAAIILISVSWITHMVLWFVARSSRRA